MCYEQRLIQDIVFTSNITRLKTFITYIVSGKGKHSVSPDKDLFLKAYYTTM